MTPTCGIKRAAEVCPECRNVFMQPFVCTTCGAEKLYDATLKSAEKRLITLEAKHAGLLALAKELEEENEELRRSVREWVCMKCETVYPGPPQAGCMCLVCPACGGNTVKRDSRAEVFLLRERHAELLVLAEKLNKHVRLLNDAIAQQDSVEFEQWKEKNHDS